MLGARKHSCSELSPSFRGAVVVSGAKMPFVPLHPLLPCGKVLLGASTGCSEVSPSVYGAVVFDAKVLFVPAAAHSAGAENGCINMG